MRELKQEAGKISNTDLQKRVVRVFYYLCVVTLQYTAPMILILNTALLYKTLGGGSWAGLPALPAPGAGGAGEGAGMEVGIGDIVGQEETVEAITEEISLAWNSLKNVFTVSLFRGELTTSKSSGRKQLLNLAGVLGFSTWWCCFAWFASAAFGIGYQSYFAEFRRV